MNHISEYWEWKQSPKNLEPNDRPTLRVYPLSPIYCSLTITVQKIKRQAQKSHIVWNFNSRRRYIGGKGRALNNRGFLHQKHVTLCSPWGKSHSWGPAGGVSWRWGGDEEASRGGQLEVGGIWGASRGGQLEVGGIWMPCVGRSRFPGVA